MADGTGVRPGPIPPSRALVAAAAEAGPRDARALAGFATQLIACVAGLAPYRQRRRAEPGRAAAQYEAGDTGPSRVRRFERRL